jgi:hypothetical protein
MININMVLSQLHGYVLKGENYMLMNVEEKYIK